MRAKPIFGLILTSDSRFSGTGPFERPEGLEYVLCPFWAYDGGNVKSVMPVEDEADDSPIGVRKPRIRWAHS